METSPSQIYGWIELIVFTCCKNGISLILYAIRKEIKMTAPSSRKKTLRLRFSRSLNISMVLPSHSSGIIFSDRVHFSLNQRRVKAMEGVNFCLANRLRYIPPEEPETFSHPVVWDRFKTSISKPTPRITKGQCLQNVRGYQDSEKDTGKEGKTHQRL